MQQHTTAGPAVWVPFTLDRRGREARRLWSNNGASVDPVVVTGLGAARPRRPGGALPRIAGSRQQGGKKTTNGPPPQPTLPAVRHAILVLFARPPPQRSPHCRKWIGNERRHE